MEESTQERPLVTFALFAYNQEKYIREAVEGAFSQTYEPLEIILSDDCSTDSTFEIMQEMAVEYKGPHVVIVRQNEVNLGTALHVHAAALKSKGSVIVVAAGDDISFPHRTAEIMKTWDQEHSLVSCVHSGAEFFAETQETSIVTPPRAPALIGIEDRRRFLLLDKLPFLSPTCAYSRELFLNFQPIIGGSIIEDGILGLRSLCSGAVLTVNDPLVYIRRQAETSGTGNSIKNPVRWNRFVMSRVVSYSNKLRDISNSGMDKKTISQLEAIYIKKIIRLSMFLVGPSRSSSFLGKLKHFIMYVIFYPTTAPFVNKVADAFKSAECHDSVFYRIGCNIFRKNIS